MDPLNPVSPIPTSAKIGEKSGTLPTGSISLVELDGYTRQGGSAGYPLNWCGLNRFLEWTRHKRRELARGISIRIDGSSFSALIFIAGVVVFGFAVIFFVLSRYGIGISSSRGDITVLDSVYFSVVTFTSLGYGDIVPVSYGRFFASLEVVSGLAFLGVAIAKLSSARQSYLIAQIYARDAQERLENYVRQVRGMRLEYKNAIELLKRGEWPTPSLKSRHSEVHRIVLRMKGYLGFELSNGNFLRDVPSGAIAKVFKALEQIAVLVWTSAAIPRTQHSQSQRMIAVNAIREMRALVTLVRMEDCDPSIQSTVRGLSQRCEKIENDLCRILREVAVATSSTLPAKFR